MKSESSLRIRLDFFPARFCFLILSFSRRSMFFGSDFASSLPPSLWMSIVRRQGSAARRLGWSSTFTFLSLLLSFSFRKTPPPHPPLTKRFTNFLRPTNSESPRIHRRVRRICGHSPHSPIPFILVTSEKEKKGSQNDNNNTESKLYLDAIPKAPRWIQIMALPR